jgi:hypothetical protein
MGTDYFYSGVVESEINKGLLDALSAYAEEQKKQVYVVDKPLGTKRDFCTARAPKTEIPKITFKN